MWCRQGRIFHLEPSANRSTHVQVPTPVVFEKFIRVYYAGRKHGMSYPAFFDLDRKDLKTILRVQEKPIMELGDAGTFDSDGIMPSCVIKHNWKDELLMYYIGWNEKSKTARYHNAIGIAVSKDNGETFQRMFDGPIMDRISTEPGLCVMPFVTYESSYRMWYQSGTKWVRVGDKYEPVYVIKHARSGDGIIWKRDSETCILQSHSNEAFSRPCVIKGFDNYRMWYCRRGSADYRGGGDSYVIESVTSSLGDGIFFSGVDWKNSLHVGEPDYEIGSFDSQMQCYPYVIELDGRRIMFYNGNDFGQTGVGLAIWLK